MNKFKRYLPSAILVVPVIAAFAGAFLGIAVLGANLLLLGFAMTLAYHFYQLKIG